MTKALPGVRGILGVAGFLLLCVALLGVYSPAFGGSLLWNDPDYVTKPALRSLQGLCRIWTQVGATEQYYPVLHSAFWIEHRLWGDSVTGYHAVSVGFHAVATGLLALILWELGPSARFPEASSFPRAAVALAALLFAFHPVCVESVAWISEEKNTLSLVFYLGSALAYLRFRERGRAPLYALAFVLYGLAILSKSVTATLPATLVVVQWWRHGRLSWRRDILPLVPWCALGALVGLLTAWVERRYGGAAGEGFDLPALGRVMLAGHIVWFYVAKAVLPVSLAFFYPRWTIDTTQVAQALPSLGVLAVTAFLFLRRDRGRAGLALWLLFVGALFPVLGFMNVYGFVFSYVADHWQYMTLPVVAAAAAAGAVALCERVPLPASLRLAPGGALVALMAVLSFREAGQYKEVETLYRSTLQRNPGAWLAHTNLGTLLLNQGHPDQALAEFRAALAIVPRYPEIHSNAGDALVALGRAPEAITEYARAVALEPRYTPALINLAHTLVAARKPAEAIAPYKAALELQPSHIEWRIDLGVALAEAGRPAEAIDSYEAALRLDPRRADAHANLANALLQVGRPDAALAHLRTAYALAPGDSRLSHNLGVFLYTRATQAAAAGDLSRAIAGYREAVAVAPDFAEARADLGLAEVMAGFPDRAVDGLREAVRLKPESALAHAYLGLALSRLGRLTDALREFDRALDLKPSDPDIRYQRGLVLRALGH